MAFEERTRDIFEQIGNYPKPPLVPLPGEDEIFPLLEDIGIKSTASSHRIVNAALSATRFYDFYRELPQHLEDLQRRTDSRGGILFTPVISATLALTDDPRTLSPVDRAATLLLGARSLYDDIFSGRFPPDTYRDQVLEMGQYPNLFSTCLIIDGKRSRVFKSSETSNITVASARRLYSLTAWENSSETSFDQLREALEDIVRSSQQNRLPSSAPTPGILTCATNATQLDVFSRMQSDETNRTSLNAIRHSFLTLCLDLESQPSSDSEAAFVAHSGNYANRWFHSSLQLVVFGNAKACAICNFSTYLDGNTMMRGASEIQKRALDFPARIETEKNFISLPVATELEWKVEDRFIQRAQSDLRSVLDNQQATFVIEGVGREFFITHEMEPVPSFISALQMTARQLTGRHVGITQFLTMSKYRCTDVVTTSVTTPENIRFVDYMNSGDIRNDQALSLLIEANASQAREIRKARRYLSFPEILTLFYFSNQGAKRAYIGFILFLAIVLLRRLGLFKPTPSEILVSHPEIYPQIPVVGRPGIRMPNVQFFGLHYQIYEDKIVITMMPSVKWTIPNVEVIAVLTENLEKIRSIIWEKGSNQPAKFANETEVVESQKAAQP